MSTKSAAAEAIAYSESAFDRSARHAEALAARKAKDAAIRLTADKARARGNHDLASEILKLRFDD